MFRYTLYKLKGILRYGLIGAVLYLMLLIYEGRSFLWWEALSAFVVGAGSIFVKEFVVTQRLKSLPIYIEYFIILLGINLLIIMGVSIEAYFVDGKNLMQSFRFSYFTDMMMDKGYVLQIYRYAVLSFFVLFIYTTEIIMGQGTFASFISGRYSKPRKENRVFMFIDMKDSTAIAEKMDDKMFYEFVNESLYYMTGPALKHKASILKYIGDEVIFTWRFEDGFKDDNCTNLHIAINQILAKKKDYFMKKYGFEPLFKSGIHTGECIGAVIGYLKKNVDFSGDTLNTSARIQGMCNQHNANLLVSEDVYNNITSTKSQFEHVGALELKGKENKVDVYKWMQS